MSSTAPVETANPTGTATPAGTAAFAGQRQQRHEAHEKCRTAPHGFLAVSHLHWPGRDAQALKAAPGTWRVENDAVHLTLGAGEYLPRPRNPGNALLRNYQGTPSYPPEAAYAVDAHYVPFDEPRETTVGAAVEDIAHVCHAPGEVRFTLGGQALALTAFNGSTPGSCSTLFTDGTSGLTTYAASRSLAFSAPVGGGSTTLDFTRAVNLPCACTDPATCPLPPAGNRLPVAVEAGEKIPFERGGSL